MQHQMDSSKIRDQQVLNVKCLSMKSYFELWRTYLHFQTFWNVEQDSWGWKFKIYTVP